MPVLDGGFVCEGSESFSSEAVGFQRVYYPGADESEIEQGYAALFLINGWAACAYESDCYVRGGKRLRLRRSYEPVRPIQGLELIDRTFVNMELSEIKG